MAVPTLALADGTVVPRIGQGTWYLGDDPATRTREIDTLRAGVDAGLRLVDTAEMYGGGRSEGLVGEAIAPMRDEVCLVDKVLPSNASRRGTVEACERSLRALDTDRIDLYLLHWPGPHPLTETVDAFEELIDRGLIGAWGVSNFDPEDLQSLPAPPLVNQILYNPSRRGVEHDLLPAHHGTGGTTGRPVVTTMAYSPIEQGRLLDDPALRGVAATHGTGVAAVLLAWAIRSGDVIAIPKASSPEHALANARAATLRLTPEDLQVIDAAFPPPTGPSPLEVL